MFKSNRVFFVSLLGFLTMFLSSAANAVVDYSGITTAVDFADVILAIVAIAGVIAGVKVVRRGVGMLLGMIGRG